MQPPIETIRLSQQAKDRLVRLKALTGIEHWNVLCRWAYCLSLRDPGSGPLKVPPSDSTVEMNWHTFAGEHSNLYIALTKLAAQQNGVSQDSSSLATFFKYHLHRGINLLHRERPNIGALFSKVLGADLAERKLSVGSIKS